MKGFFALFVKSYNEIFEAQKGHRQIFNMCICAFLIALSMVIESLSFNLPFGKVNFAFIPLAAIGMLFGPTVGLFSGALCDILGFLVKPTGAFLPLYTLIGAFQGMLYGLILYRKWGDIYSEEIKGRFLGMNVTELALRLVVARLIDVLLINMIINTSANIHYGFIPPQSLSVIISGRLTKNLLELLADLPLLLITLPAILTIYSRTVGREKIADPV